MVELKRRLDTLLPTNPVDRLNRLIQFYDEWGYTKPCIRSADTWEHVEPIQNIEQQVNEINHLIQELHETYRLKNLIRELEDEQLEMRLVADLARWLL